MVVAAVSMFAVWVVVRSRCLLLVVRCRCYCCGLSFFVGGCGGGGCMLRVRSFDVVGVAFCCLFGYRWLLIVAVCCCGC